MPASPSSATISVATPAAAWRVTGLLFFINGCGYGIWATQIPLMKVRLGLSPAGVGLLLLCLGLGAVAAMSMSGFLIRRFGNAALLRWSAVAFCVLLPAVCAAPVVPAQAVLVAAFGAMGGVMDVAMNAYGSEAEQRHGRAWMSSFHGMWSVGGLSGAGAGGLLLGLVSGPVQALIAGIVLLALAVAAHPGKVAGTSGPAVAPDGAPAAKRGAGLSREAILIGIVMALTFSGEGVVLDWSPLYLNLELGASTSFAAAGYAAFAGAMAVMRFVGDRIRSRVGGDTLVRGGAVLGIVGVALGPLTGNQAMAVIGYAIAGVGLSNVVPVFFSAAGRLPHPEASIATASTLGYAGLLVAPPLLGFVANATSIGAVFGMAAVAFIAIAVMARLAR